MADFFKGCLPLVIHKHPKANYFSNSTFVQKLKELMGKPSGAKEFVFNAIGDLFTLVFSEIHLNN